MPHLDRFGAQDTPDEVQERIYALLRTKTPEEKLRMVLARMQFMRDLRKAAERLREEDVRRRAGLSDE
jgi:hypothetical protein